MSSSTIEKLSNEAVLQNLKSLKLDWELTPNQELRKVFEFKGFYKTMGFVNAIAWIAQKEMHHPDLEVSFNKCVVKYTTHDSGGVTEKDFDCVRQIEALL